MPEIFAPQKMTITTLDGHGVTLKAGETREVNNSVFAAAIQQGAFPVNLKAAAAAIVPRAEPVKTDDSQQTLAFDAPGVEGSAIIGDDEDDAVRVPLPPVNPELELAPPTIAAVPGEAELIAALHRIARRNDPKEFNQTGLPKASVVSKELGGHPVDAETREKAWEQVARELGN